MSPGVSKGGCPMNNSMPVGNRLIETLRCEQSESSFAYTSEDMDKICSLVDESIALVKRFRTTNGFSNDLKPSAMVVGLFKNFDRVDEKQRLRLTAQCSEEFLVWCRREIRKGEQGVCRLLLNFAYDTSYIGYLGKDFNSGLAGHSHFWIPRDSFIQIFNWFCRGKMPEWLTSEFMCIFELRQVMETAFHRVIGLGEISVPLRIPHALIPDILHRNITIQNFSPPSGLTIKDYMHVYDWTDKSIHLMCTDWVWVVWKAMMIGGDFFTCPKRTNGQVSIYDNFELSKELLSKVRKEFVTRVKDQNKRFAEFSISWIKPDAAIVDDKGASTDVVPSIEIVTNECRNNFVKHFVKWFSSILKKF